MSEVLFKYNPNIYDNDLVIHGVSICNCCGKKTDKFIRKMYCVENVDCICLECVASGQASKKFDGTFIQDAMPLNDNEKYDELFCRTPGYYSWQGEYWLTCCNDYCAFIGYVGTKELEELGIADEVIFEYEKKNHYKDIRDYLTKDGGLRGYLFKCLHCDEYHLWVDAI